MTSERMLEISGIPQVGDRICALRDVAGISQSELAELADLGAMTVSRYECGKRRPNFDQAVALCAAFRHCIDGFPADVLLGFDPPG